MALGGPPGEQLQPSLDGALLLSTDIPA